MYGATLSHKVTNLTSADLGLLRAYAAAETSPNWTYERLYWDHLFRNFDSINSVEMGARRSEGYDDKYLAGPLANLADFDHFVHPIYGSCFGFDPQAGFEGTPEYIKVRKCLRLL